jgi:hypothetical protein
VTDETGADARLELHRLRPVLVTVAGHIAVEDRVDAIALAPAEVFWIYRAMNTLT